MASANKNDDQMTIDLTMFEMSLNARNTHQNNRNLGKMSSPKASCRLHLCEAHACKDAEEGLGGWAPLQSWRAL